MSQAAAENDDIAAALPHGHDVAPRPVIAQRFARLNQSGFRQKARAKEKLISHELRRFKLRIPEVPVVTPTRVVDRDLCAYFGGHRVKGTRVEAFNDHSKTWKRGVIAEEGSATRRHSANHAVYHVLVVVQHEDGTKKAYRCECLRKLLP